LQPRDTVLREQGGDAPIGVLVEDHHAPRAGVVDVKPVLRYGGQRARRPQRIAH
jgi:hypothetical protein